MIKLRPKQSEILAYQGGKMGISAVPGSGKTWTLSLLAADIITNISLDDEQEVLIVTLVNSAVDNFSQRVGQFLKERGLLPNVGYRVRTLHGLAHDIVRERPELVGLENNFQIIDDREANRIREEAARAWLRVTPDALEDYLNPELDEGRREWVRRQKLPELVEVIGGNFIRYVKDLRLNPQQLRARLADLPVPLPLAEMGCAIYDDYQRGLAYRGAVDFDDLIALALRALESDPDYLRRLRTTWPYILEDEAQDSSRLQEQILGLLSGEDGNWVRVGDPNQAIFETFTTANPEFLRYFVSRPDVKSQELPNSGRSTLSIIDLANRLVEWTQDEHPVEAVRDALHYPPLIEPAPEDDPQPNPSDLPNQIHLVTKKFTPAEEAQAVADSLERWLPEHPQSTVAVLVPRNQRGNEVVDQIKQRGLEYVDSMLRSSTTTRTSAGALTILMIYLSDSGSARKLAKAYEVWRRASRDDPETKALVEKRAKMLRTLTHVEDFLWPGPRQDWLMEIGPEGEQEDLHQELSNFRDQVRRWQAAILLPVDQLVLTLAQDLFTEPTELAVAHKLAVLLRQTGHLHPDWRLPEMTAELEVIARNERRFLGFGDEDTGFDPEKHKGKVVVATVHKAKGLEWDRVYLMSVNNYDFPSAQGYDQFISEKWFVRGNLDLGAETLAQLDSALSTDEYHWYQEGTPSWNSRLDYVRERLRLLYVGITRAKSELVLTWNTGRRGDLQPAVPFMELMDYWEEEKIGRTSEDTAG